MCILGKGGPLCNVEPVCGAGAQVCGTRMGQEGSVLRASGREDGEALPEPPRGCGEGCEASEICPQLGQVTGHQSPVTGHQSQPCHQPAWHGDAAAGHVPLAGIAPGRAIASPQAALPPPPPGDMRVTGEATPAGLWGFCSALGS